MADQINELLESVKARTDPELHADLETVTRQVDDLQTELEQLREEKESLQIELEKTTAGTLELASEMEERYQQLFESAFEGIYTAPESLDEYLLANQAFADLLGYESGDALCSAVDSIEEDVFVDSDRYAEYAETLHATGELNQFEYQVHTADGDIRWVSDSVRTLEDDKWAFEGYRGAAIDITEKKNQKEALKRQTNLGIVLNRVLRHNLRNDLSVVRGYTQMLADKLEDESDGETALNAIDGLINLTEKARDLDEIVAKDSEPEPANIPALIDGVVTQMRREHPSATISNATEEDEEITAEVLPSFRRAIQELLENAIKHSGDDPRVEVTIETNPDDVQIRIADNGPGLEEQEVAVLQSGSEKPLLHGSGLGLWMTHWIVTSQGGVIDATVTEEGTTLSVLIPRTTSEGGQKQLAGMVRARDQYKSAFEEAGDGMTITDDEARILDVNTEAARIFGVDKNALIGRPIREFIPEDFDFEAEWGEIKAAEMKRGEMNIVSADGGVSPIEYTAKSHIVPGQHLIVSRDITERKERERTLTRMKSVLQEMKDGAAIVQDGRIKYANSRMSELIGYDEGDLIETQMVDYITQDYQETVQKRHNARIAGDDTDLPNQYEIELVSADGEQIPVELNIALIEYESQPATLSIIRDISERKWQEKRFQEFIEHSNDVISVLGVDGAYKYQSPSSKRVVGYKPGELLGENVFEYVHPDDRERAIEEFREGIDDPEKSPVAEFRFRHKDGSYRWLAVRGNNQLDNPAIEGYVLNSRDITKRKEREQGLQRERDRLDKFAGVVSHDLRNPLNVATGRLDLAIENCESEHLEPAAEALDRMENLIDDVLTLARAGETVGETEDVELDELIGGCWRNVDTKSADLLAETDAGIRANKTRLTQLFENLFRNAVEHGGDAVTVTVGEFDGGLYVEDDGQGIPADEREDIFETGYTTDEAGTGFGLSIVKEIVEAHDWEIRITESTDGGARFEITGVEFADE